MIMDNDDRKYIDDRFGKVEATIQESIERSTDHIKEIVSTKITTVETGVKMNSESINEMKKDVKINNDTIIRIGTELRNHKENHTETSERKKSNIGYIITISLFGIGWFLTVLFSLLGGKK